MKVVQINSVCGVGSTGKIAVDLSTIMMENDIENYIIYGLGQSDYPYGIRVGDNFNIRTHQLHTRLLGWHGYVSKRTTTQIIKKLDIIQPDIIHLHNIHGFYLNIELLFKYLAKTDKPVIWTLHDCWSFTGHCPYFDYIGCDKWIKGCYDCPQKGSYPVTWFFDRSKQQWEDKKDFFTSVKNMCIVTPSQWLANIVKQSFLNNYNIKVINNGIDTDAFKPSDSNFRQENNLKDKIIIIGVAGFWEKRKGLLYFIELSKLLDEKYKIVLVGLTEKQKKQLPKDIIGINRTNNIEELAGLYSTADVFVNPTLEDNFPTVNIEALACGVPVITYKTGGSPEGINKDCGIVVEKGNLNELFATIKKIGRKQDVIKRACLIQASKFNKKDKYNEYINLYRSR